MLLGKRLIRRRIDLDPRYENRRVFADERAGGRYRIINAIELGRRDNYEPGTLAIVERAYDLDTGAISRYLEDGEPIAPVPLAIVDASPEAGPPPPEVPARLERGGDIFPPIDALIRPEVDAQFALVEPLVIAAIAEHPEAAMKGDLAGGQIFTDPGDARRWDLYTEWRWSLWQRAYAVALARVLDPARQESHGNGPARTGLAADITAT